MLTATTFDSITPTVPRSLLRFRPNGTDPDLSLLLVGRNNQPIAAEPEARPLH